MRHALTFITIFCLAGAAACNKASAGVTIPPPAADESPAATGERTAIIAGGCFWGIEAVFEHTKGVKSAVSGYAGGAEATAHYDMVSGGSTGHAEAVKIVYDPSQISYGRLLQIFFSAAHDPTELNRQGPDDGPQYRSAVFFADEEQQRIATEYIDQLNQAGVFKRPIATEVVGLKGFYPAEPYHQDYAAHHPKDLYIAINDLPKVERLREQYPQLYR